MADEMGEIINGTRLVHAKRRLFSQSSSRLAKLLLLLLLACCRRFIEISDNLTSNGIQLLVCLCYSLLTQLESLGLAYPNSKQRNSSNHKEPDGQVTGPRKFSKARANVGKLRNSMLAFSCLNRLEPIAIMLLPVMILSFRFSLTKIAAEAAQNEHQQQIMLITTNNINNNNDNNDQQGAKFTLESAYRVGILQVGSANNNNTHLDFKSTSKLTENLLLLHQNNSGLSNKKTSPEHSNNNNNYTKLANSNELQTDRVNSTRVHLASLLTDNIVMIRDNGQKFSYYQGHLQEINSVGGVVGLKSNVNLNGENSQIKAIDRQTSDHIKMAGSSRDEKSHLQTIIQTNKPTIIKCSLAQDDDRTILDGKSTIDSVTQFPVDGSQGNKTGGRLHSLYVTRKINKPQIKLPIERDLNHILLLHETTNKNNKTQLFSGKTKRESLLALNKQHSDSDTNNNNNNNNNDHDDDDDDDDSGHKEELTPRFSAMHDAIAPVARSLQPQLQLRADQIETMHELEPKLSIVQGNLHNESSSTKQSRFILRMLVSGLLISVLISLILVYTIKYCLCKRKKLHLQANPMDCSNGPSLGQLLLFGHRGDLVADSFSPMPLESQQISLQSAINNCNLHHYNHHQQQQQQPIRHGQHYQSRCRRSQRFLHNGTHYGHLFGCAEIMANCNANRQINNINTQQQQQQQTTTNLADCSCHLNNRPTNSTIHNNNNNNNDNDINNNNNNNSLVNSCYNSNDNNHVNLDLCQQNQFNYELDEEELEADFVQQHRCIAPQQQAAILPSIDPPPYSSLFGSPRQLANYTSTLPITSSQNTISSRQIEQDLSIPKETFISQKTTTRGCNNIDDTSNCSDTNRLLLNTIQSSASSSSSSSSSSATSQNSDMSAAGSSSSTKTDDSTSTKTLFVKLDLNKASQLSASDLLLVSKLIDLPDLLKVSVNNNNNNGNNKSENCDNNKQIQQ